MPIYEYECTQAGHRFEVRQKMSDPLIDKCPTCQSPVKRLISNVAFHLKGGGWYSDNYAKPAVKKDGDKPAAESTPAAPPAAEQPAITPTKKKED